MIEQAALVFAVARDNVLLSPEAFAALRRSKEPVQLAKRIIKDMRGDGQDPFVLQAEDIVTWTKKDMTDRRVML